MRILQDVRSVAVPTQLCAIMPFLKSEDEDNIVISNYGKLYARVLSFVLIATSGLFCCDVLFNAHYYKIMKSVQGDTEEINQTIETLFCIISYTMIVISCVYNGSKHCRTYKDIAKIDEYLEAGGFEGVYKAPLLAVFLAILSCGVFGVAFFYVHTKSDIPWLRQCVLLTSYGLQMVFSTTFALYLRIILKNITRRIEFVNQKLDQFAHEDGKENWRELSNLIEMFCKFRYITENMNAVTGVALLFYMGYAFYTVTNQSYLAFSTLTTHVEFLNKFDTMGLSVAWVMAEIIIMSVICSSCDAMSSEQQQRRTYQNQEFLRRSPLENPIFTDIKSLLFILKVSGLLPIYELISSYEIGPPTKPNEFYSFFIRGVVHGLTIFSLYKLFTPGSTQLFYSYSETDSINQWIELLLCIFTFSGTVLICAKNAKISLKIINEILKVDEEINRQFGTVLNNNCKFSSKFIIGICFFQIYILILKLVDMHPPVTVTSYVLIGFYGLQSALSTIFIVYTSALLCIVTVRFGFLNMILNGYSYTQQRRKLRHPVRRVFELAGMENFPEDSLFTFRLHNKLLRIYKSINECCSLILVGYMGFAFYTITTTTYNLFVQITGQGKISSIVMQLCFAWLSVHTAMLTLLAKSCGQATKEANTTSQILARVYGKSKEYQNIIDKFLTKSIKQEVQFTAYGFFVIDNSTLFKIFSAVTTYLVILIQFKQLEDSKIGDVQPITAAEN